MKKLIILTVVLLNAVIYTNAQTAMQFSGVDCNGNLVDLFADLDAGKAVILHFYMPNCGSCPPPAQKIQTMANNINAMYPGMVKGYAFPFQNTTTCVYSSSWVSTNSLSSLYAPMDSGAVQVAHYGGFGMPTVVLLGGTDHRTLFSTLSFSTSDTTIMRDSILAMLGSTTNIKNITSGNNSLNVFPNPANEKINVTVELNETTDLMIDITDISGKKVAEIINEKRNGIVSIEFNTSELQDGNYIVRMNANGITSTQKVKVSH
jgi:hypothetical protein